LREIDLSLQPDECEFLKKELIYLSHIILDKRIKANSEKIRVVKQYPVPKKHKELRQFLGPIGYYRCFIKDFSSII